MKPIDSSFAREKFRQAATFNLGDYVANRFEAVFAEATSQIADSPEGDRVREEQYNALFEDLPQIERYIALGNLLSRSEIRNYLRSS
jgi:hypothetical protein